MAPTTSEVIQGSKNYVEGDAAEKDPENVKGSRIGKKSGESCDYPSCSMLAKGSCPSCKLVGYCSDYHRHGHWDAHKSSCSRKYLKEKPLVVAFRSDSDITGSSGNSGSSGSSSNGLDLDQDSLSPYKPVVANKDIKSGSVIVKEEPVVSFPNYKYDLPCSRNLHTAVVGMRHFVAPSEEFEFYKEYCHSELLEPVEEFYTLPKVPQVCFGCYGVMEGGLPWDCKRCGVPLCSEDCEEAEDHKFQECAAIQEIDLKAGYIHRNVEALYMDIATLRGLIAKRSSGEKFRQISELMNHPRVENYRKSAKYHILLASDNLPLVLPLSIKFGGDPLVAVDVCCVVDALSGVYSSQPYPSKKCLYTFCASLQHDCIPNCLFTPFFNNFEPTSTIVLIAATRIKEGEILTVDVLNKPLCISRQDRRTLLRKNFIFGCDCQFCSDRTDCSTFLNALRCGSNHCPDYILPSDPVHFERSPWTCQKCGERKSWKDVEKKLEEWREAVKSIPIHYDSIGRFSSMKRKLLKNFHPNHYLVLAVEGIQAKLALGPDGHAWGGMKALKRDAKWLDRTTLEEYDYVRQYCYQSLRFLRVGNSIERAIMLSQLFYVEFLLALRKLHYSNVNLKLELVNFRMQISRLKESAEIFSKHFHPSRLFVGNKTKGVLQMFDNSFILFQIFYNPRGQNRSKRTTFYSDGKMPPVKFDKIFKPILEAFMTPDPVNENLLM